MSIIMEKHEKRMEVLTQEELKKVAGGIYANVADETDGNGGPSYDFTYNGPNMKLDNGRWDR